MALIDVNTIKENDIVKFINTNKTLFDGTIKKVSNNCLGIIIDTRQKTYTVLVKDQRIELILVCEHQAIKCSSIILGITLKDSEEVVIISIPDCMKAIERRGFERLAIVMDIEYSLLSEEQDYQDLNDVDAKYFRSLKKTYTVNISAGGICFIVPKNAIDTQFVLISLDLKEDKIIALCEKIRIENTNESKHDKVAYKFIDIKNQHRQLILDFISDKLKESNN